MKHSTALKHVQEIIDRLNDCKGIIETPLHYHDRARINQAWIFGSVAKGALEPNDVDIFIDIEDIGDFYPPSVYPNRLVDKEFQRRSGIKLGKPSTPTAIKILRKGMKKISIHTVSDDLIFSTLDVKYLIYPTNEFYDELEKAALK